MEEIKPSIPIQGVRRRQAGSQRLARRGRNRAGILDADVRMLRPHAEEQAHLRIRHGPAERGRPPRRSRRARLHRIVVRHGIPSSAW